MKGRLDLRAHPKTLRTINMRPLHRSAPSSRKAMIRAKGSMAQPHDSHSVSGSSDSQIICEKETVDGGARHRLL